VHKDPLPYDSKSIVYRISCNASYVRWAAIKNKNSGTQKLHPPKYICSFCHIRT